MIHHIHDNFLMTINMMKAILISSFVILEDNSLGGNFVNKLATKNIIQNIGKNYGHFVNRCWIMRGDLSI